MEEDKNSNNNMEVDSTVVKAGKRTYFFDIKATRNNDLYLTITERKRVFNREGQKVSQKFKIFLYKEDFENFSTALQETIAKIEELKQTDEFNSENNEENTSDYSSLDFNDL